MGTCKYCGEKAGALSSSHKECEQKHKSGVNELTALIRESLSTEKEMSDIKQDAMIIAKNSYIKDSDFNKIVRSGWESAINDAFEDDILTEKEEERLQAITDVFNFDESSLKKDPVYLKVVKGGIIREVLQGTIPERVKYTGQIPFNFMKSEKPVWIFQDVEFHEMKTFTQYKGGYGGVTIRVAKGLYYRAGGFRGNPVHKDQMVLVDKGLLAVTNQHLYFSGSKKNFRVKYDKIVVFQPYSDGIGIQKAAQNSKPQIFITNDGWFTYNLIANLAKL